MTEDQSARRWPVQDAKARLPTLKELLLAETPRAEIPIPSRRWRRRTPEALGPPPGNEFPGYKGSVG